MKLSEAPRALLERKIETLFPEWDRLLKRKRYKEANELMKTIHKYRTELRRRHNET